MDQIEEEEAACGGESFTSSTKVLLASGAAIPIARLKPGDKVLATNVKTGKTQAETVAAVLVHYDADLYDLKVEEGTRTAVIRTTASHLFWDTTTRKWVKAAAFHAGDHLRTPTGGTATVAGGYTPNQHTGWMWDLTIPGDHDFYIDTIATPVLAHNVSCPPLNNSQAADMANRLGYRPTNIFIRGQRVFYNGKNYIVQDIDSHSGGLWKMARTVCGLQSKETRMGTYDYNGNYIGP